MAHLFQERTMTLSDGAILHYVDTGAEKPDTILFVHGWLMRGNAFKPLAKRLAEHYRIVWLDLRGHGGTESDGPYTMSQLAGDVKALLEHLRLEDVLYVGFSMGAYVLYQYVRDYGCLHVKKAVVMDMPPKSLNDDEWKHGQYQGHYDAADLARDLDIIAHKPQAFMADFCQQLLVSHQPYEVRKHQPAGRYFLAQRLLFRHPPLAYWKDMNERDYRGDLDRIDIPLAIVYATPGSLFEEGAATYMQAHVPNGTLYPIRHANHASMQFRTKELQQVIEGFAESGGGMQ